MKRFSIPQAWFPAVRNRLADAGLPVRFDDDTNDYIIYLAGYHGISQADVVRILVGRSLKELQAPSRVA
jgi:hypothetical protein